MLRIASGVSGAFAHKVFAHMIRNASSSSNQAGKLKAGDVCRDCKGRACVRCVVWMSHKSCPGPLLPPISRHSSVDGHIPTHVESCIEREDTSRMNVSGIRSSNTWWFGHVDTAV
jgi:hypothetical protein